jgi:hypothetical protein
MTRFLFTTDPSTAARTAKNENAVPGLPNQPEQHLKGRTPMVRGNRRRLCAHADQNGQGMHWLTPGQQCPAGVVGELAGEVA